jgi:hypothetical protein
MVVSKVTHYTKIFVQYNGLNRPILRNAVTSNIRAKIRKVQTFVFVIPYFYLYVKHTKFCALHYII